MSGRYLTVRSPQRTGRFRLPSLGSFGLLGPAYDRFTGGPAELTLVVDDEVALRLETEEGVIERAGAAEVAAGDLADLAEGVVARVGATEFVWTRELATSQEARIYDVGMLDDGLLVGPEAARVRLVAQTDDLDPLAARLASAGVWLVWEDDVHLVAAAEGVEGELALTSKIRRLLESDAALADGQAGEPATSPDPDEDTSPGEEAPQLTLREEIEALERKRIIAALEQHPTQTEAAKALGIPLRTFLNRLDALGIPRARKGKKSE